MENEENLGKTDCPNSISFWGSSTLGAGPKCVPGGLNTEAASACTNSGLGNKVFLLDIVKKVEFK